MNSPRNIWDTLTAELSNKKDMGQVREPGVSRWMATKWQNCPWRGKSTPDVVLKKQLMLFGPRLGYLFGPRLGYEVSKWVLSRTMFPPRMPNGSPEKLGSTSRDARSQCMSESQGRSIRGFDWWISLIFACCSSICPSCSSIFPWWSLICPLVLSYRFVAGLPNQFGDDNYMNNELM